MGRSGFSRRFLSFLLAALFLLGGSPLSYAKKKEAKNSLSPQIAEEIAIGEQIHAAIISNFYTYTDPKVVDYVTKIGNSLAAQSERTELPYHFTVLYNDKIYAASAPGGFVYVTTGMLYFIENEAQLAAVLAHEIGELQYKDPKNSRSRKILAEVSKGGAVVASAFGPFGALAAIGLVGVNAAAQPRAVTMEQRTIRADKKALQYMVQAGEDPQGMIDLLYKFLNAKPEIAPYFYDYYQSRPITTQRFKSIEKEFGNLSMEGKDFSANRDLYQEMTKGVREIYKQ